MKSWLILLLVLLTLGGCANRVIFPSQSPSSKKVTKTHTFLFWGLSGEVSYELYESCPSGNVYEVYSHANAAQVVYTIGSLGLYSPRSVQITCSARGLRPDRKKSPSNPNDYRPPAPKTKTMLEDMPMKTPPAPQQKMPQQKAPQQKEPAIYDLH